MSPCRVSRHLNLSSGERPEKEKGLCVALLAPAQALKASGAIQTHVLMSLTAHHRIAPEVCCYRINVPSFARRLENISQILPFQNSSRSASMASRSDLATFSLVVSPAYSSSSQGLGSSAQGLGSVLLISCSTPILPGRLQVVLGLFFVLDRMELL